MTQKQKEMLEKIKLILYGIFSYLSIDIEAFGILMILMCIDSVVGAIKSVRLGKDFKFKIMLWGISMKLIFLMIPVTLALMARGLGYDFTIAVNIVISILTVSESYSILGNIYMAKNKVKIKRMDMISSLLITLRRLMSKLFKGLIGKLDDEIEK
tara:strand:+ start:326 stop:790 length:465 start_codon:yes stop_codon:yes gene_type:complete